MSSAISTEPAFKAWHFFLIASLVAATAGVLVAGNTSPEHLVMLSAGIVSAGIVGLALYRTLFPLVTDDADEGSSILVGRARAALEREKALVLRTIKELEFDRAMGKVAEPDFNDMVARLRVRALGLMKQLDERPRTYRDAIEREMRHRLATRGVPALTEAAERAVEADAATLACESCGAANDHDARFCKRCGTKLAA
jgi:ribosomal protein L40E